MRAGRIIADTTPDGLFADTGTTDPDAAFLTLIERDAHARAAAKAQHPLTRREAREQAEHAEHPHHGSAS
jgi:ABC-2 type transport system ATP-binding protein